MKKKLKQEILQGKLENKITWYVKCGKEPLVWIKLKCIGTQVHCHVFCTPVFEGRQLFSLRVCFPGQSMLPSAIGFALIVKNLLLEEQILSFQE